MLKRGLMLAALVALTVTIAPPRAISQQEAATPAFNAVPPAKGTKLPAILGKDQLWAENAEHSYQTHAYELAAKVPVVLHQQPCYCYCDRMGHKSLHSCFESAHGAQCSICLKELYYSYSMHKRGRSAAQIRQGIIKGEWKTVDLQTASSIN